MATVIDEIIEMSMEKLMDKFQKLSANQFNIGNSSVKERRAKLDKLHKAVLKYRTEIKEAMYSDYKKHESEVDLTEIYPITSELKDAKRNLSSWMSNQSVSTPLALMGSSSFIKYEPKGVVLIISPWNFPFNLTLGPLVGAVAAGNAVMLKPSEMTPHSSRMMQKIISEVFDENEVVLVEGGIETSQNILTLPFNHIFFTGAPSIGKVVMAAAAKNLTSVTLELGGKSPTIIDKTANIDMAARRVSWAKFVNNGQICIAPDYVLVHKDVKDEFLGAVKKYLQTYFTENASNEPSYDRIVNNRHFNRVKGLIDDAISKGAEVFYGNQTDAAQNYISPTVLTNVTDDSSLMQNEIFGPVMPVKTFENLEEVVQEINAREKPLALYIYSRNQKNINYILQNTRAGGGCINHSAVHFFNTNLPFGGSNNSGIGKAHGFDSFKAFSNPRGILRQHIPNALELLLPPYNNFKQKLIDLTIKFF